MYMSADVIGMIISLFAFGVAMLGGVGWMISHQTRQIDRRFDAVDVRMDRFETRMDRFETRMERVETELVDVKIAIARFEGPAKRLQQL
ncbi:hypothetical protein Q9R19_01595 [Microbacterium sp. ARD32]|uniref:hypothetical protein n=1 Tax=Microbacterium sp. ARD32 TaxID=2962577 RepID=UPI0028814A21|nr:hypothetical protein [Microbacterium sp. ARD32]MDT0156310.1 hypothetical protein [Microbacterium sp. ARD32]